MNIALFAGSTVGDEVAKFFRDNNEPIRCLVLDSKGDHELNHQIIVDSGITDQNIVFHSDSLYEEETLLTLESMDLDLAILAWWPYILKENLIKIPRMGCLNFHPSYLPYNRGKHYNFWAIVEETPFGVTLHFVDPGTDTGDIAFQSVIEKTWEDTGETLYQKAQLEIVRLFKENYPEIKRGNIPRIPQDISQGSFHRSRELEPASKIDLGQSYNARELLNLIRARTFYPYPGAWFIDDGKKYEVRVEIKRVNDDGQRKI